MEDFSCHVPHIQDLPCISRDRCEVVIDINTFNIPPSSGRNIHSFGVPDNLSLVGSVQSHKATVFRSNNDEFAESEIIRKEPESCRVDVLTTETCHYI